MKFSIIIPVHNASEYVRKALESIRNQSFTDYELICICDACTDNSSEICKRYADIIRIVNYNNDGLSRSLGLDLATGEWILFMDDDDWWLHEYVLEQINSKLTEDIDVLAFSFIFRTVGYATPRSNQGNFWPAVWNKCWKRSAIGDTRFPEVYSVSDSYFHTEMMLKNLRVRIWDMPMYYYNYMREGSISEIQQRS